MITQILEFIPSSGALVQVDCALGWQSLKTESESEGSLLKKLGIDIDLGRTLNKNKNPIAENGIKEFHKERLRIDSSGGPVTDIDLAIITRNSNSRIRYRGLSSKEIVLQRDQITNSPKPISDAEIAKEQFEEQKKNHPKLIKKSKQSFKPGDNVFLKSYKSKLH